MEPSRDTALDQGNDLPGGGSKTQAIAGGLLIPALAVPLFPLVKFITIFFAGMILSEVLNRPVRHAGRLLNSRYGPVYDFILTLAAGAITTAVIGFALVSLAFGAADRRLLFRVGAGALLVIAIAFWIWLMRSAEEDRVFLTFTIVGGWIGATAGFWAAALDSGKPDTSSSWPPPAGSESGDKIQNYCFGCGSLLAAGIAICPSCGVPTQTAQPPSPVAPTTTS